MVRAFFDTLLMVFIVLVLMTAIMLISSCTEEWQDDKTPIARDDFSTIQIEAQICEQSSSSLRCLRHLKARIK